MTNFINYDINHDIIKEIIIIIKKIKMFILRSLFTSRTQLH